MTEQPHWMVPRITVYLSPRGDECHVRVGDVDISRAILAKGLQITVDPETRQPILHAALKVGIVNVDGPRVVLAEETVAALEVLGWTPPEVSP